ncbi:hypothetical protein GCM10027443_00490 [Pontibacter brevis]
MLKTYYENEHIRLRYDEEFQLGVGEWKGFVSSSEFREMALRALEFANSYGITRWLSDRRKMKAIRQQDQQWAVEVYIPKMLESPLRRMAAVVSEDIFNNMAMEEMLKRSGGLGNISLRHFNNVTEAMAWLKQPFDKTDLTGAGTSSD